MLEMNIRDQFGSKRYLGSKSVPKRYAAKPEVPLLNMDLHQYFSKMNNKKAAKKRVT
jgi:hypothetical protein